MNSASYPSRYHSSTGMGDRELRAWIKYLSIGHRVSTCGIPRLTLPALLCPSSQEQNKSSMGLPSGIQTVRRLHLSVGQVQELIMSLRTLVWKDHFTNLSTPSGPLLTCVPISLQCRNVSNHDVHCSKQVPCWHFCIAPASRVAHRSFAASWL